MPLTVSAKKFLIDGIEYETITPSTVKVRKIKSEQPEVRIPDIVNYEGNQYVVRVLKSGMQEGGHVLSILIPTSIEIIESKSFSFGELVKIGFYKSAYQSECLTFNTLSVGWSPLQSISLPDMPIQSRKNTNYFTNDIFYRCKQLRSVEILSDDITLHDGHPFFYGCPNITEVYFNGNNPSKIVHLFDPKCPFVKYEWLTIKNMTDAEYRAYKKYDNPDVETLYEKNAMTLAEPSTPAASTDLSIRSSIDDGIPISSVINKKRFAVIIGNENYSEVAKVDYALSDARLFSEYCKKCLGVPDKNVRYYEDATFLTMNKSLKDISAIADAFSGDLDIIFYYAGHGIPDKERNTYLIPVDAAGSDLEYCIPTEKLYRDLSATKANSIMVFLDACFSGAARGKGMIDNVRGVAIKPRKFMPSGNMIVFSAASNDEAANPLHSEKHGLFTYHLLEKIKESHGDILMGELADGVSKAVLQSSLLECNKPQTPTITTSAQLASDWRNKPLK